MMIAHGVEDYSTPKRRRFTICDRLALLRNVRRRVATGESIRSACKALNIVPKQYREWSKSSEALTAHKNPNAKSTCVGVESVLKPIEEDLLRFIFELREQVLPLLCGAVRPFIDINHLGDTPIILSPLLKKVTRKKADTAAINSVAYPIARKGTFLRSSLLPSNLHVSYTYDGVFLQHSATDIMFFTGTPTVTPCSTDNLNRDATRMKRWHDSREAEARTPEDERKTGCRFDDNKSS